MKRISILGLLIIIALVFGMFILSACSSETAETTNEVSEETQELILTYEELKEYNGKDGKSAYVAYEGIIYDVTGVSQWISGMHGGNNAGEDITENLNKVSHGTSKLNGLKVVGKIAE